MPKEPRAVKQSDGLPDVERHLHGLSRRVRSLRARRGMTRRALSRDAEVSERYLAQLEGGEANPSIALLWRIAQAMDIDFLELLSEEDSLPLIHSPLGGLLRGLSPLQQQEAYQLLSQHFGENRAKSSGLALIGLRGAGKTTLGKRVAREIGLPFLRLGGVIEKLGGMALDEMFSLGGQKAYRRLEREALEYVIEHHPVAVVEAGGSLVSEHDTFNLLRESYFTVWLQAKPEEHMQRVIRQGDTRPMEGNRQAMDDLRHILAERDPYYRTSDYSLNTSGRSVDDCLAELKRAFDGYKGGQDPAARKR